jgi:hypothetical protein
MEIEINLSHENAQAMPHKKLNRVFNGDIDNLLFSYSHIRISYAISPVISWRNREHVSGSPYMRNGIRNKEDGSSIDRSQAIAYQLKDVLYVSEEPRLGPSNPGKL